MIRRMHAGVLLVVWLTLSLHGAVSAQTPEAVVPTSCSVQPVSMLALLATLNDLGSAGFVEPLTSISMDEITPGTPVDAEDLEGITFVTNQLVGCTNSFEVMSVLALLSESFQARLAMAVLEGNGMDAVVEQLPLLASESGEVQGILDIPIRSAWYADDSHRTITAILEPEIADPTLGRSFLVTYVFSVDHWLIHDVQLITGT